MKITRVPQLPVKDESLTWRQFRATFLFRISSWLQAIQITICQLGHKSYAVVSVCYLRLDLAVSNNKTLQIGAVKRQQLTSLVYKTWWNGVPSWSSGFVLLCPQGPRLRLRFYSSSISTQLSLMLPDDILLIPAGGEVTKKKRGGVCARAVS